VNIFRAANGAASFLILSMLVSGLAKHLEADVGSPVEYLLTHSQILYLGLFIVVFRIKTLLDDDRYFAEHFQDQTRFRYIGFVLAVVSWIFWGLAAYLIPSTQRASELMAVSIAISTLWIAIHIAEILVDRERRNSEIMTELLRERWLPFNLGYMLLLAAHSGRFQPLIQPGAAIPLFLLLGLLLWDIEMSRSFSDVAKPNPDA
jgi:hypothetical protein